MPLSRLRRVLTVAALGLAAVRIAGAGSESGHRWMTENETQRIQILLSEEEVRILPLPPGRPAWEWGISLVRYGGSDGLRAAGSPFLIAGEERADLLRGSLVEWFRNTPEGLEHGLEIRDPAGASPLGFEFAISGTLTPKVAEDGQTVLFRDASGTPVLASLDLRGIDAEGREVAARWERIEHAGGSGAVLRLDAQASDHVFPLQILTRVSRFKGISRGGTIPRSGADAAVLSAPSSDLCAGAEPIPGAGPFPYLSSIVDITDATVAGDPPLPSCQPDVSRSVWFSFTPASTAAYTFSVCSDAPTGTTVEDTVLALYSATGSCAGLAEIGAGCDDDTCGAAGLQSVIGDVNLAAGSTYYIVAWSYGTTAPPPDAGSLQLQVVQHLPPGPAPPNDLCAGAEPVPGAGPFPYLTAITADIGGATTAGDPPAPSCQSNVSRSIWYSFTPADSGRYTFSVCADATTGSTVDDTVLAIYEATSECSGLMELPGACDDDSCASEPAQSESAGIPLTAGTRYLIVVWEYGTAAPAAGNTSLQMRVDRLASPFNDTCAAAAILPLDTLLSGSTLAAANDTQLPAASICFAGIGQTPSTAAGRDVVYRFTAPEGGRYSFRAGGPASSTNAVIYVSSDCPASSAPAIVGGCLGAANRTSAFPEEVSCLPLGAGQTVYVFLDEDSTTSGGPFTIEANRCSMEVEPNGTPGLAGAPACGTEGSIAPAGDVDFFALGIPEAGSRVFAMVDGAAGNSTDFDLRVTTDADTLEYDDYNNDVPFGSASPNVSGTRLNGSASYLRVSHYSPVAQSEPYRLYASVQPPASRATPEVEPDGTLATATGGANEYYSGSLSGVNDVDVFSFSAVAGDLVQIGLDLDPARDNSPFNGSLAILDSAGATLLLANDPASSSSNLPGTGSLASGTPYAPGEAIVYRIRSSGMYYARVAWSSGTPGDYLLSISHDCRVGPRAADRDGDGFADAADCAPADPTVWAIPGEATGLAFSTADTTLLQWSSPAIPGGTVVSFDLLRSTSAESFQAPACLVTNATATSATDSGVPGVIYYYLVRSRNSCGGNLGTASDGTPRTAGPCP